MSITSVTGNTPNSVSHSCTTSFDFILNIFLKQVSMTYCGQNIGLISWTHFNSSQVLNIFQLNFKSHFHPEFSQDIDLELRSKPRCSAVCQSIMATDACHLYGSSATALFQCSETLPRNATRLVANLYSTRRNDNELRGKRMTITKTLFLNEKHYICFVVVIDNNMNPNF